MKIIFFIFRFPSQSIGNCILKYTLVKTNVNKYHKDWLLPYYQFIVMLCVGFDSSSEENLQWK